MEVNILILYQIVVFSTFFEQFFGLEIEIKEFKTIYHFFKEYKEKLIMNSDLEYYLKILVIVEFRIFLLKKI